MRRRNFLCALGGAALPRMTAAQSPRIQPEVIEGLITALSRFGRTPGGTFEGGVSRVGYSDADIAGRRFVMGLMKETGAAVRVDAAGNIFASRPGADPSLAPVLFGSHIDSMPSGGNFDGDLGSLSSIHILKLLDQAGVRTRRPLTVVIWSCEEATFAGRALNGSRAAAGQMPAAELDLESAGVPKSEAIRRIGGDPGRIETAVIRPGSYHAYVELHIEQGGTLERSRVPVGVVDGIVAIDHFDVVVSGFANHAGTTPMPGRQDALVAASRLTLAVREIVTAEPGAQVGTVGHMEVFPNAANVIPGEVRMSIELRDLSTAKLERLAARIRERARAIAAESATTITIGPPARNEPATAAVEVQRVIETAASRLGLPTQHLPSGAGHDAQMMARLMPMGMIFVPSIGGISHSPRERTGWQDCANGANVLLETVCALAS